MVAHVDTHSRLVAWLKILLPLAALAMLSTLFLVPHRIDPGATLPYADVDVEGLARDQRIGAPAYSGMTEDGSAVSLRAASARPQGDGGIVAVQPRARIDLPSGRSIAVSADAGAVDRSQGLLSLRGGAVVTTSDGYRLETAGADARLDVTALETQGRVSGTAPMGYLTAGHMALTRDVSGAYLLRFDGGVKLVYRP